MRSNHKTETRDLELIESHMAGTIEGSDLQEFEERWSDESFQQRYFIIRGLQQGLKADDPDELEDSSLYKGKTIRILLTILVILLTGFITLIYIAFQQ